MHLHVFSFFQRFRNAFILLLFPEQELTQLIKKELDLQLKKLNLRFKKEIYEVLHSLERHGICT